MPKLLWISTVSLHDDLSAAAVNSKLLLEALAQEGWSVYVCSALNAEECDPQSLNTLRQKYGSYQTPAFALQHHNVNYAYIGCRTCQEDLMSLEEMQAFYELCCKIMDSMQPDVVLGFGFNPVILNCMAEAQRRGMWTAYLLLNNNYRTFNFPHVDLILTNSQRNAQYYQQQAHVNAIPIGEFFDPELYAAKERHPRYITYINPALETGLAFFAKIALAYQHIDPEQRFLVVNRQQRFAHALAHVNTNGAKLKPQDFPNVDLTAPNAKLSKVYEQTKVLLMPSLWWESWGRPATEAVLNGIPVVASNSGGLSEATLGAGIHLDVPPDYETSFTRLPTDQEIQPWLEALHQALTVDFTEKSQAAQRQLQLNRTLGRLLDALVPLLAQGRHRRILFNHPDQWLGFGHEPKPS